ncbi:MAG: tRNA (guanosine(37)-N1)-methyltransferase TrmD [Candidatus Omnitrophica bacterium]|nr:tRNA (guanosine(37)-N1)-methyltransferase TrmD [Candidatus Omnitrophota bacterium]
MTIDVLTLFPKMFEAVLLESIIKRAQKFKKLKIRMHNIRDYTDDKHRKVDDRPFGGGPGMVLTCQPVMDALKAIKKRSKAGKVIMMSPQGEVLDQGVAVELSKIKEMILISGHYEGVDERLRGIADRQISIGNYVLTGGELPAMVLIDSVARLIPGVLGDEKSTHEESFSDGLLEYPHYTRPADYRNNRVPDALISGNHNSVNRWRKIQSIIKTIKTRPDLIKHIRQLEVE